MKLRILAACLAVLPAAAPAEPLIALGVGQQLVKFDSATPGTTTTQSISGGNGAVICIDANPDGLMFGVGLTGMVSGSWHFKVHMIDALTGAATQAAGPSIIGGGSNLMGCEWIPDDGSYHRVITSDGGHQAYNTSGGSVGIDSSPAYATGDVNEGQARSIHAIAYNNNTVGGAAPTLYGLDLSNGVLVRIGSVGGTPDAEGTGKLTTIGPLGVTLAGGSTANFDISGTTGIAYATLQTAAGIGLYTIDLATGAATLVGLVGDGTLELRGLTAYTPPATGGGGGGGALDPSLLLGLLALGWRRRKIGRGERI